MIGLSVDSNFLFHSTQHGVTPLKARTIDGKQPARLKINHAKSHSLGFQKFVTGGS